MDILFTSPPRCEIFSIPSDEFCRRQARFLGCNKRAGKDNTLIARADIIVTDALLLWLSQSPGTLIVSASGEPLLGCIQTGKLDELQSGFDGNISNALTVLKAGEHNFFARKLRRREPITVNDLRITPVRKIEKTLFDSSFKGVTDFVTKYIWPVPTWFTVRAFVKLKISPNAVTIFGIGLCVLACVLFHQGQIGAALITGWIMTFLDTVDGKLARVTATSSNIGNILDHSTDVIHPPIWWACLGMGLVTLSSETHQTYIFIATAIIVGGYIVGRFIESGFKMKFGFNPFLWQPFDSKFRLFISRRNVNLLILTLGFLSGHLLYSFYLVALWKAVSTIIQFMRLLLADRQSKAGQEISIFLATAQN